MINEDNILNEQDLRFLKAYLDNEEKKRAFITTYMYILNVGNGDGISESELMQSEEFVLMINENESLNEGIIGNVLNFMKGKNAISKYYKGLDGAAKNYVQKAKQIDKMDQDKKSGVREKALKSYEDTIKALDDVKSQIDELKKDSKILQKYDSFANNKYKIKLFLTGRKADVSLSKLKGYEDKIEDIKAKQKDLQADIDEANKEAEEKKKEAEEKEEKGDEKVETPAEKEGDSKEGDSKEDAPEETDKNAKTKEKIQKQIDGWYDKLDKVENDSKKASKESDSKKSAQLLNTANQLEKNIEDAEEKLKNLGESSFIPLSLYALLETINEDMKCLENSIEENL